MAEELLAMRDIMDYQLETRDQRRIGRVDDIEAELRPDGSLVLTYLVTGPQALLGRVSSRLRPYAQRLLRDRFEHRIPIGEIEELGNTIRLRGTAADYGADEVDRWIVDHILRFIPGSGR